MDRAIPAANRLLARRWREHSQAQHISRLRSVRPALNFAEEQSFQRPAKSLARGQARSLNRDTRRKRLVDITFENYAMLDRIRGQTSCYSLKEWKRERKRTERVLERICEFPYRLGREKRVGKVLRPLRNSSVLVYKQTVLISSKSFLVEMHRRPRLFSISVLDPEKAESYSLTLGEEEAVSMMENGGYDRIIDYLAFANGELMLLDSAEPRTRPRIGSLKSQKASIPVLRSVSRMRKDHSVPYLLPSERHCSRKATDSQESEDCPRPNFSP